MGKIQVMSSHLANMIAAGEVIERPSSVIKELVENSIDALSSKIEVRIYNAGRSKIVVKDDGIGMDKDDAVIAFKRHASSKLLDEYQLFKIKTMGFRGEALPSIASIAKVTMFTSNGVDEGSKVIASEESIVREPYKALKGTTFIVEELFYNTPVRLKYLKSDSTEVASCLEVMQRLALSFTSIAFEFYIDDKLSFKTTGRGDLLEVISRVYGVEVAKKMIKVDLETFSYEIHGYIGKPELTRSTRYYMITILNNRNVYLPQIQKSIIAGYGTYIFNSKYPFVVLDIRVDHSLVDVNVHPSKKEVRLSNEVELSNATRDLIANSLKKENALHQVSLTHSAVESKPLFEINDGFKQFEINRPTKQNNEEIIVNDEKVNNDIEIDLNFQDFDQVVNNDNVLCDSEKEVEEEIVEENNENKKIPDFKVIGQLHNTYIVLEGDDGFYLVDQHAANERINYEKFEKILNANIVTTDLLVPLIINLSPSDIKRLNANKLSLLKEIGLNIEAFGLNTIKVSTIPTFIKDDESYIEELIMQAIHDDKISLEVLRRHVIATMACKASIKAHDHLNLIEMEDLIKDLFKCNNPTSCPHGRPTIIHFTSYDVEKMFKRSGI